MNNPILHAGHEKMQSLTCSGHVCEACATPFCHRCKGACGYHAGGNYRGDSSGGYGEDGLHHALNDCIENVDGVNDRLGLGPEGREDDSKEHREGDDAEDVEVGGGFDWGERKSVGGRLQEQKDDGPMLGGAMLFTTSSKLNNACHGQHREA
jgi:hypothetical protein